MVFKMNQSALAQIVFLGIAMGLSRSAQAQTSLSAGVKMTANEVTPIAWRHFRATPHSKPRSDLEQSRQLLQNAVRYNLGWMKATYPGAAAGIAPITVRPGSEEAVIRPPASAVLAVATALKCGAYDEKMMGVSREEAISRTVGLINALCTVHIPNLSGAGGTPGYSLRRWGSSWQSALWTTFIGQAGWMLWDDLDASARVQLANVVSTEADRFIAPGYKVIYWKTVAGKENFAGDTKAEENAWNAMEVQLACAMMPRHPHAAAWRRICSELMISAFANQQDALSNEQIIDGKPVKDWLHGFNLREDGGVVNHGIVHPDYMTAVVFNLRSFLVQSLARQQVSQTASFNAPIIYATLVNHQWPSPPFLGPGGTIYQPGKVELYYPQKTDWSRYRFDIYYLMDLNADAFGLDKDLPHKAREWFPLRAQRLQEMQARHPDGHLYDPGEFDTYQGREQLAAWQFSDAYLLLWLKAQGKLSLEANWLAPTSAPKAR